MSDTPADPALEDPADQPAPAEPHPVPYLSRLHVQGFRRLADVDVELRPLNVLIGANSCGKSSLLDVFQLLSASAQGKLSDTLNQMGGMTSSLTNLTERARHRISEMFFRLTFTPTDARQIDFQFALTAKDVSYEIINEKIWYINKEYPICYENPPTVFSETILSQRVLTQGYAGYQNELRDYLRSSSYYHALDVSARALIRLPQPLREAFLPGPDGEDLFSCLYTIRETNPECFEAIQATLRVAFPKFQQLGFPPVGAGSLYLTWKESTSEKPFFPNQLSEGTLRFLWLVTLLHSPKLPSITLLDEPEVSLHPEMLEILVELFREASLRTQLVVATHSDRLVRFLKPSEVLTMDINESGAAELTWADALDLEEWLKDYTLDDVWRMGRMGARP